jgi:predicted RNA binding protein YcfA (HicA-like mRNA interferase family)
LAWDNGLSSGCLPKRYTSRELVQLAKDFGWRLVGTRGDHHNFKHHESRFIVTIVHPQKDVPVGRAIDTVKKIKLEVK